MAFLFLRILHRRYTTATARTAPTPIPAPIPAFAPMDILGVPSVDVVESGAWLDDEDASLAVVIDADVV